MDIAQLVLALITFLLLVRYILWPLCKLVRIAYDIHRVPCASGPTGWLSGHILQFSERGSEVRRWTKWIRQHPRLVRFRMFYMTEIDLVHPETAALLLKTSEPKSEEIYGWLRPWLGNGLLLSSGKRWARDRRLLTPGFHFDILRGYLPVYKQAVGIMLDQWAEIGRQNRGATVNASRSAKLLTLDIILRCIMSFTSNCQLSADAGCDDEMAQYAKAVQEITHCLNVRSTTPFQFFDVVFALSANGRKFNRQKKLCHSVSQRVIRQRRRAIEEQTGSDCDDEGVADSSGDVRKRRYLDFLDILLSVKDEDGRGLDDHEIQEQVDTFLFEGHDTTASALQWTFYYLAKHPHLQEKCRQEVLKVLDENRELHHEHLNSLEYLTQFVKESMRLSSPVPFISRTLTQPLTIDGYHLPKGTLMGVTILAIHRNPEVWTEPGEFNPDHFRAEEAAKRHPFAFIPFSAGPRNCIGQSLAMEELKSVVALTLLRFKLTYDSTAADPILTTDLVSRSTEDIQLFAEEITDGDDKQ